MVGTKSSGPHVLILGAGTTGLLIAQGLKKNGIPFTIFERESANQYRDHPREWSMGLFWGAHFIRATLPDHLKERFDEAKSVPHYEPSPEHKGWWPLYNGKTGELTGYMCRAVNVEDDGVKVTVHFQDGTTAVGDIVVACDGGKSSVRTQLLGPEKAALSALPLRVANLATTYTAEQALFLRNARHPIICAGPHPDKPLFGMITIVNATDESRSETWVFQPYLSEWTGDSEVLPTSAERLAWLKSAAANFGEPWNSAVKWIKEDTYVAPDQIRYWKEPVQWPNCGGRVTLAGGAAHAMPPYLGQGLNNAMEDAASFVTAILSVRDGEKSLQEAVDAYDAEVLDRGSKEIRVCETQAGFAHDFARLMESPGIKFGLGKPKEDVVAAEVQWGW